MIALLLLAYSSGLNSLENIQQPNIQIQIPTTNPIYGIVIMKFPIKNIGSPTHQGKSDNALIILIYSPPLEAFNAPTHFFFHEGREVSQAFPLKIGS